MTPSMRLSEIKSSYGGDEQSAGQVHADLEQAYQLGCEFGSGDIGRLRVVPLEEMQILYAAYVSCLEICRDQFLQLGGDCDRIDVMEDRDPVLRRARAVMAAAKSPFQARVDAWIQHCFGPEIGADRVERNHRFIEEALELVQSGGCTASEAHQLVDYVFGRPVGEMRQEVGGVMNTLAALCTANSIDLDVAAETELARVWTKSDQIRAKQAAKPKHSPLPEITQGTPTNG